MFGFQYMKADPTTYVMAFKNGKIIKQGLGLNFMYAGAKNWLSCLNL